MNKTRPIRIFWQNGVTKRQIIFVNEAIIRVLKLAEMDKKIEVQFGGEVPDPIFYKNIDTNSKFFGHYNANKILDDISSKQQSDNHNKYYSIFLLKDEIFINTEEGKKSIGGLALRGVAVIIGVYHDFLSSFSDIKIFNIKYITIHELGHLFYLPSKERKEEIEISPINGTRHCANNCIMYHSLKELSVDHIFCSTCLCELRNYFKE